MKTQILLLLLLTVLFYQPINSQNSVNRKVLITLQPGEKIMYAESCISLSITNNQVNLVTKTNEKIYVYENGHRRGPYDDMEEAQVKTCTGEENSDKCSVFVSSETYQEYLAISDQGTYSVKLNGKTYGPYPLISDLHVWPDKSGFVATTIDKEMKTHLITSEGLNLELNGDIEKLHFSPKGKKFVFAYKERQAIDASLLTMDFSKMTQEQLLEFAKKQEEKAKNAPKLQSYIYVNGTTKFGPYDLNTFYSNNPAFTKTGGDNWIMTIDDALYINGIKIKDFQGIDLNTCHIWLSNDGKKYVIISYNKVIFSDGQSFNNPLEPSAVEKNGKVTIMWVSLENEKDLVFYSREL